MLLTFQDAVNHCLDFVGGDASAQAMRHARRASQDALRELHTATNWSYLYTFARLVTSAPYSTGTIDYDHTGGANERQVTLTGGTWPTWAAFGTIVIAGTPFEVDKRISSTILTLKDDSNPGADLAGGTTYRLYRDQYELPADYKSGFEFYANDQWHGMAYVHPKHWAFHRVRTDSTSSGAPLIFTVMGSTDTRNRLAIRVYPFPDQQYDYDYVYLRKPGDLGVFEYKTGTVSTMSGSATITGSGTDWNTTYNGLVMRIKATDVTVADGIVETGPFGFDRNAYYVHESLINAVASTTSLTTIDTIPETLSGVKYVISSLVDIEGESMTTAYLRLLEKHMAIKMNMESKGDYFTLAKAALIAAREADTRYSERRRITVGSARYSREYDWHRPLGPDVL